MFLLPFLNLYFKIVFFLFNVTVSAARTYFNNVSLTVSVFQTDKDRALRENLHSGVPKVCGS